MWDYFNFKIVKLFVILSFKWKYIFVFFTTLKFRLSRVVDGWPPVHKLTTLILLCEKEYFYRCAKILLSSLALLTLIAALLRIRGSNAKKTMLFYRVFIKFCVFSLHFFDFSELCQFCCSAGFLPGWCVYKHWHRRKTESKIFLKIRKNTIFNEHPVSLPQSLTLSSEAGI